MPGRLKDHPCPIFFLAPTAMRDGNAAGDGMPKWHVLDEPSLSPQVCDHKTAGVDDASGQASPCAHPPGGSPPLSAQPDDRTVNGPREPACGLRDLGQFHEGRLDRPDGHPALHCMFLQGGVFQPKRPTHRVDSHLPGKPSHLGPEFLGQAGADPFSGSTVVPGTSPTWPPSLI